MSQDSRQVTSACRRSYGTPTNGVVSCSGVSVSFRTFLHRRE